MGKKNRQKIKWKPLILGSADRSLLVKRYNFNSILSENQDEQFHQTPEKIDTDKQLSNLSARGRQNSSTQHSNYSEVNSSQELPSMNSGQSTQNVNQPPPFYSMVGGWSMPQYPRFYYPTLPAAGYRPLQPLEWFNPRLPANCQYFYAVNSSPQRTSSKAHYQNQIPFYWNSVLLNPYSGLLNQSEENTSNYIYPGHYYGPASFNQTNHVTAPPQQQQQQQHHQQAQIQNKTVDQHKPKKKRKRKRKRKLLPLKIDSEDQTSSCSTQMEDDSSRSSETREVSSNVEDDLVDGDPIKVESPKDACKMEDAISQNKPIGHENLPSRDQLPRLPLVDDLFAVTLVDDIVARAIEIAIRNQSKDHEINENDVDLGDEVTDDQYLTINDEAEFYLPEDDDSEDSELQELMENSLNSVSPSQSGFRPLDEEDVDDVIDLSKVDDESGERISENCDEASPVVGREQVNWLDCNGFRENESESPEERELVTEIVFISETSFMDESHPARASGQHMSGFGEEEEGDGGNFEERNGDGVFYGVEEGRGNLDSGDNGVEGGVENGEDNGNRFLDVNGLSFQSPENVDVLERSLINVEIGENNVAGFVDNAEIVERGMLDVEYLNSQNLANVEFVENNPLYVDVIPTVGDVEISRINVDIGESSATGLVGNAEIIEKGQLDFEWLNFLNPENVDIIESTPVILQTNDNDDREHVENVEIDENGLLDSENSILRTQKVVEIAKPGVINIDITESGPVHVEIDGKSDVKQHPDSTENYVSQIDIAVGNATERPAPFASITKTFPINVESDKNLVETAVHLADIAVNEPPTSQIGENNIERLAQRISISERDLENTDVDDNSIEILMETAKIVENIPSILHKSENIDNVDIAASLPENIGNGYLPSLENIDNDHPHDILIDNSSPIARPETSESDTFINQLNNEDFEDEEFSDERYMDDTNHEQFYDPLKYKDYYQICTNVEVPDSPSQDKITKIPFDTSTIIQPPPPKPPRLKNVPLHDDKTTDLPKDLVNPRAEIIVHEMDNVSECGSEDVDTIGHQYQKGDEEKHIYVNQLSLAAELLRTHQSIPYDNEFKPLSEEGEASSSDVAQLQDTASTSHSNREIYDSYYGTRMIQLQDVTTSQPQKAKEVSDSGVQSEESSDDGDDVVKGKGERPTGRPIGYKVLENKAKPLSAMLKGKGDPLCLCCSVM